MRQRLFALHARLRSVAARLDDAVYTRAIVVLHHRLLAPLEVKGRRSMFVYQQQADAAVFYLRLFDRLPRIETKEHPSSERSIDHRSIDRIQGW